MLNASARGAGWYTIVAAAAAVHLPWTCNASHSTLAFRYLISIRLKSLNFRSAALVARSIAEADPQKGLDQLEGEGSSNHFSAQTK